MARDKALVENAVRLVYQRIYARLRNRLFSSLEELNEAIWELLEKHNNTPFQSMLDLCSICPIPYILISINS